MYLQTRKKLLNFKHHPPFDPDLWYFEGSKAHIGHFFTIWPISLWKTDWISQKFYHRVSLHKEVIIKCWKSSRSRLRTRTSFTMVEVWTLWVLLYYSRCVLNSNILHLAEQEYSHYAPDNVDNYEAFLNWLTTSTNLQRRNSIKNCNKNCYTLAHNL